MSGDKDKKRKEKEEETGGSTGSTSLTPLQWAWKWIGIPILTFFAVAGVTAITVFFVLQGGFALGVSSGVVDLIASVSGIVMFIAYAASWGRYLFEKAGIITSNPAVDDPKKKIPHAIKEKNKTKASRYTIPSLFISFLAAGFVALGAYLGWVVFAAEFGLPMLIFQIGGVLSGLGMGVVLGIFLHGLQIGNYEEHLANEWLKNNRHHDASQKISRGKYLLVLMWYLIIATAAAVGFGVFKAFPINDFFASLGLATGELLFDITVFGTMIIIISSVLTTSWCLWNEFKAWRRGEPQDSGNHQYPPPTTLLGKICGHFTLICAAALNAAGPVISIFIFILSTSPIPPVAITLWVFAAIFFFARWIDFRRTTGGAYTMNSFKRLEEWFGVGKTSSSDIVTYIPSKAAGVKAIEMAVCPKEDSKSRLTVDTGLPAAKEGDMPSPLTVRPSFVAP